MCDQKRKFSNIGPLYSIISVFDIIEGSHNSAGIPGLDIPQSRIPGLRKQVRDWNTYLRRHLEKLAGCTAIWSNSLSSGSSSSCSSVVYSLSSGSSSSCSSVVKLCWCCAGIELVSETTEEERALGEGVKPDLVQGIEFAYSLPAADLVVMLASHLYIPACFAAAYTESFLQWCDWLLSRE